ncbi:putative protein without homology [Propionibacterium freudenreichii subsp. shermanii]|nr:putative protein without homology [Propionibacterium freudenreichii subsp. shermanii]
MEGVGTPIIGRPRPLPGHRPSYTLICDEPIKVPGGWKTSATEYFSWSTGCGFGWSTSRVG